MRHPLCCPAAKHMHQEEEGNRGENRGLNFVYTSFRVFGCIFARIKMAKFQTRSCINKSHVIIVWTV